MSSTTVRLSDLPSRDYHGGLSAAAAPHASVVLDCTGVERLPVAAIAAALTLVREHGRVIRLAGLAHAARQALDVIDTHGVLASQPANQALPHPRERLFSVSILNDDLCLHLTRGLPSLSLMAEAAAHDWIGGAAFALLVIDLKEIENLNSLLVSWLLQLSHAAAPVRAVLSNPSAQAATQLRQLRLDHILTVC